MLNKFNAVLQKDLQEIMNEIEQTRDNERFMSSDLKQPGEADLHWPLTKIM